MLGKSTTKAAVITRTKDRPLLLKRALRSISEQSFQDFVLVIVNDGGNSNTIEKLLSVYPQKFIDRLEVINNKSSIGMEAASNVGINSSRSRYIALLDDDDTWHPKFLEETIGFLESTHKYKGVVTGSKLVTEEIKSDKIIEKSRQKYSPFSKSITLFELAGSNLFTNNSFVYEREAAKEIGLYNEKLPVLGDWEFNIRFLEKYDVAVLDKTLSYYHRRTSRMNHYKNSILEDHLNYSSIMRNKLIREDLERNELGIGVIAGMSDRFNIINSKLEIMEAETEDLRGRVNQTLLIAKYLQTKADEHERDKQFGRGKRHLIRRATNKIKHIIRGKVAR